MSDSRVNKKLNTKIRRMEKDKHYGNGTDLFTQALELALVDLKKDEFEAFRQQQERNRQLRNKSE